MIVIDNVDVMFSYRISFNGQTVEQDASEPIYLPLGANSVELVAIDSSGNASTPISVVATIYPQIGFISGGDRVSEGTKANFLLEFPHIKPDYPVTLMFQIQPLSLTATLTDLDVNSPLLSLQLENIPDLISLEIFVLEDSIEEVDETFIIRLMSAYGTLEESPILISPTRQQAALRIIGSSSSSSSSSGSGYTGSSSSSASSGSSSSSSSGSSSSSSSSSGSSSSSSSSGSSSSSSSSGGTNPGRAGGSLDILFLILMWGLGLASITARVAASRNRAAL